MGDWYYIGHYGQLGPLTREQMQELMEGGVIARDTYVWKTGMSDWVPAVNCADFAEFFRTPPSNVPPPPPPSPGPAAPPVYGQTIDYASPSPGPAYGAGIGPASNPFGIQNSLHGYAPLSPVRSDKSRVAGGILQLILPGVGRMYLGYVAIGILQLVLSLCGVGYIWSIIDGVIMLSGGVRMDGYGRQLND